jgi:hypothetical protein
VCVCVRKVFVLRIVRVLQMRCRGGNKAQELYMMEGLQQRQFHPKKKAEKGWLFWHLWCAGCGVVSQQHCAEVHSMYVHILRGCSSHN